MHLPEEARSEGICLQWQQGTNSLDGSYIGCWALDNILIINMARPPDMLHDNFDPIDLDNWLFFPGGKIKVK